MTVVVFGATGTAGSAVVSRCLADGRIGEVRAVTRRPLGRKDARLTEVDCADFLDLEAIRGALSGVDACFFCLGVSAGKVKDEGAYREITVGYALAAASVLKEASAGHTFHYLSGSGANAKSRMMWARVKAEAETKLNALGLPRLFIYRPGYIYPAPDRAPGLPARLMATALRLTPSLIVDAEALGQAMIDMQATDAPGALLDKRAIRALAT